jgi:hypothetical protein
MRLHDAVRYAAYISRSLSRSRSRFGDGRDATAALINTALSLVASIMNHGFRAKKGQSVIQGRKAAAKVLRMIMRPAQEDDPPKYDGEFQLRDNIRKLWRQMRAPRADRNVRIAIRDILKKLYVGALIHADKRMPETWSDATEAEQKAWENRHSELEQKFDALLFRQVPEDLLAKRLTGQKGSGTSHPEKEKASVKETRVTEYGEVLPSMLRSVEDGAIVYVNKDLLLVQETCDSLARSLPSFVIRSTNFESEEVHGKIEFFVDEVDGEKVRVPGEPMPKRIKYVILVVEGHQNAAGVMACIAHCKELVKFNDKQRWSTVVVGKGDESDADLRCSYYVGPVSSAVRLSRELVGEVEGGDEISSKELAQSREIRTYSSDLKFANIPNLTPFDNDENTVRGGLALYADRKSVSFSAIRKNQNKARPKTLTLFVLRVKYLPNWKDELPTLARLAKQRNVMLVTNYAQHKAIVDAAQKAREKAPSSKGQGPEKRDAGKMRDTSVNGVQKSQKKAVIWKSSFKKAVPAPEGDEQHKTKGPNKPSEGGKPNALSKPVAKPRRMIESDNDEEPESGEPNKTIISGGKPNATSKPFAEPREGIIEIDSDPESHKEVAWNGPAVIMNKKWDYIQVEECGGDWDGIDLHRDNLEIRFLQVRPSTSVKTPYHHAKLTGRKGDHVYVACDNSREVTGEYVDMTSKNIAIASRVMLKTGDEISQKLDEVENRWNSDTTKPKPSVYVLCNLSSGEVED